MTELAYRAKDIKEYLAPMVAMFTAKVSPKEDDISLTQAYERYGRKWIDRRIERGELVTFPHGNKNCVSVAEIELLRAAERTLPMSAL